MLNLIKWLIIGWLFVWACIHGRVYTPQNNEEPRRAEAYDCAESYDEGYADGYRKGLQQGCADCAGEDETFAWRYKNFPETYNTWSEE